MPEKKNKNYAETDPFIEKKLYILLLLFRNVKNVSYRSGSTGLFCSFLCVLANVCLINTLQKEEALVENRKEFHYIKHYLKVSDFTV